MAMYMLLLSVIWLDRSWLYRRREVR
jgi:hypothetical protein